MNADPLTLPAAWIAGPELLAGAAVAVVVAAWLAVTIDRRSRRRRCASPGCREARLPGSRWCSACSPTRWRRV